MKIGIMGGTFDPIHNGHLYIANEALKQLDLDEIWWVPGGSPPHKGTNVSSRLTRLKMCHLAVDGLPHMTVKDFEVYSTGASYTYKSLEYLRDHYPMHRFFFIMGEDSLFSFSSWVNPDRIAACANLVVAIRHSQKLKEKTALDSIKAEIKRITDHFDAGFSLLHTKNVPISSTNLRLAIRSNKPIKDFVPKRVEDFIRNHEIYLDDINPAIIDDLIPKLKKKLPTKRFWHTIGVMETAGALAIVHDYPVHKARLAGLLHDCAKCYSNKVLLQKCRQYNIPVTDAELNSPHLLHGKVGAYIAEHEYDIDDKRILHAIAVHTTGEVGMNLLDSLVFVADYIEPGRTKAQRLPDIRRMSYDDLDTAIIMILEDTIEYLKRDNAPMDQKTIDTYNWFSSLSKSEER